MRAAKTSPADICLSSIEIQNTPTIRLTELVLGTTDRAIVCQTASRDSLSSKISTQNKLVSASTEGTENEAFRI